MSIDMNRQHKLAHKVVVNVGCRSSKQIRESSCSFIFEYFCTSMWINQTIHMLKSKCLQKKDEENFERTEQKT